MSNTNSALPMLTSLLARAREELAIWYRNGIPAAAKLAEIAALEAQIAKLS